MCDIKIRHIIYIILTIGNKAADDPVPIEHRLVELSEVYLEIKSETYFLRNRLQNNLHYYIYLPDIIKYIIMKQSLFTESVHQSINIPAFGQQLENSHQETWIYQSPKHHVHVQLSNFTLIARHISCNLYDMAFLGVFTYPNGRPLIIPHAYRQIFFKIANKNGQTIRFFTQEDRNQLLLRCSLSFNQTISTVHKINQCLKSIYQCLPSFEQALQAIGLAKKYNKYAFSLLKSQLKMKKAVVDAIRASSVNDNLDIFSSIIEQNSSVVRIKQVVQNPEQNDSTEFCAKKGGYFQIRKKNSIIQKQSGERQQKYLAWKTPLNYKNLTDFSEAKMKKQIQLVQKIVSNKYLLTYYFNEKQPSSIYMDYVPGLLKDYIHKTNINFKQLLDLAQQLVESVAILHKSNIVHRDLKPENVLVDGQKLKLIDYAQSTTMEEQFKPNHLLGCTIPYSPVQCILRKQQGFNKKQIDLWSIPIMLYEMVFKNIPMFYTRFIGLDILEKWRSANDFSIFPIYRKKKGLMSMESIISLIAIRGIQINPQERLSLKTYKKLISQLQEFQESIYNIA